MGAHRARPTSTVGKVAGRGALTAAAALALTGGTATFAFADEVPQSASEVQSIATDHAADVQHHIDDVAAAGASELAGQLEEHGVDTGDTITDGQHALSESAGHVNEELTGATKDGAEQLDEQAESFLSFT